MIALIVCYFCIFSIYIIKCKDNKKFYNLKVKFTFLVVNLCPFVNLLIANILMNSYICSLKISVH